MNDAAAHRDVSNVCFSTPMPSDLAKYECDMARQLATTRLMIPNDL